MKREKQYTSSKVVFDAVKELIATYIPLIPGCDESFRDARYSSYGDSINLNWNRSWYVSCKLSFRLRFVGTEKREGKTDVETYTAEVEIGWPSTGRTVAESVAAIALYSDVTKLGAQIEALCNSFGYIGDEVTANA